MKNPVLSYTIIYLCIISLTAIFVTISDKRRARLKKYRISEKTLLIISALGGSLAMYITMLAIRHKTKHIKFMAGIPLIMVLQAVVILWLNSRSPML